MSALLVLTLFLATGAAHALPSGDGPSIERAPGTLVAIWNWVASLLEVDGSFLGVFETSGGNGGDLPLSPLPTGPGEETDGGGFIDPNGNS
jgi:hypothetical protein